MTTHAERLNALTSKTAAATHAPTALTPELIQASLATQQPSHALVVPETADRALGFAGDVSSRDSSHDATRGAYAGLNGILSRAGGGAVQRKTQRDRDKEDQFDPADISGSGTATATASSHASADKSSAKAGAEAGAGAGAQGAVRLPGVELSADVGAQTAAKLNAQAGAHADSSGASAEAAAEASVGASAAAHGAAKFGGHVGAATNGHADAQAGARAAAGGKVSVKLDDITVSGGAQALAGASAGAGGSAGLTVGGKSLFAAKGRIEASAGAGGKIGGEFSFKDGKLVIGGQLGATLGIGGGVDLGLEVDFSAIGDAIAGLFKF